MLRLHPHALDLAGIRSDPAHAGRADWHAVFEGEQEATVWRLELADRGDVVIHGFRHWKPEPVSRFQLIVAPCEVVEPQVTDQLQIAWQVSVPHISHVLLDSSAERPCCRAARSWKPATWTMSCRVRGRW